MTARNWWNTRTPLNTMAMPRSSAASITLSSPIRATRLDHRGAAGVRLQQPVREREEGFGRASRPFQVQAEVGGAQGGDPG